MDRKLIAKQLVKLAKVITGSDQELEAFNNAFALTSKAQAVIETLADRMPISRETDMNKQQNRQQTIKLMKEANNRLLSAMAKMSDVKDIGYFV